MIRRTYELPASVVAQIDELRARWSAQVGAPELREDDPVAILLTVAMDGLAAEPRSLTAAHLSARVR